MAAAAFTIFLGIFTIFRLPYDTRAQQILLLGGLTALVGATVALWWMRPAHPRKVPAAVSLMAVAVVCFAGLAAVTADQVNEQGTGSAQPSSGARPPASTRSADGQGRSSSSGDNADPLYVNKIIKFSAGSDCEHMGDETWLDLDASRVVFGADDLDDFDLVYFCDIQANHARVKKFGASYFGDAPTAAVDRAKCWDAAQAGDVVHVDVSEVVAGETSWCAVTNVSQIAWIRVIDKGRPYAAYYSDLPTLTLQITLWPSLE